MESEIIVPESICNILKIKVGSRLEKEELVDRLLSVEQNKDKSEKVVVSSQLQTLLGCEKRLAKGEPLKLVVRYIKDKHLDIGQDYSIVCDQNLERVVGKLENGDKSLTFQNLKKYIQKHVADDVSESTTTTPTAATPTAVNDSLAQETVKHETIYMKSSILSEVVSYITGFFAY